MKTESGFSLIEIVITCTIVAVISVAGIISYQSIRANARDQARLRDLNSVKQALEAYRTDNRQYPTDINSLIPKYVTALPRDPKNNPADSTSPDYKYLWVSGTDYIYCGLKESGNRYTAPTGCSAINCAVGKACNIGVSPQ